MLHVGQRVLGQTMPHVGSHVLLTLFGANPPIYNLLLLLEMSINAVGHCR